MMSQPAEAVPTFDEIRAAFERQRKAAEALCTLAGRQRGLIHREDHRSLMALLERRRTLLQTITTEHGRLSQLNIAAWRKDAPPAERETIDVLADTIDEAMQTVMAYDEADQAEMRTRADAARRDLGGVSRQRQANQAYARAGVTDPRFENRG